MSNSPMNDSMIGESPVEGCNRMKCHMFLARALRMDISFLVKDAFACLLQNLANFDYGSVQEFKTAVMKVINNPIVSENLRDVLKGLLQQEMMAHVTASRPQANAPLPVPRMRALTPRVYVRPDEADVKFYNHTTEPAVTLAFRKMIYGKREEYEGFNDENQRQEHFREILESYRVEKNVRFLGCECQGENNVKNFILEDSWVYENEIKGLLERIYTGSDLKETDILCGKKGRGAGANKLQAKTELNKLVRLVEQNYYEIKEREKTSFTWDFLAYVQFVANKRFVDFDEVKEEYYVKPDSWVRERKIAQAFREAKKVPIPIEEGAFMLDLYLDLYFKDGTPILDLEEDLEPPAKKTKKHERRRPAKKTKTYQRKRK